MVNRLLYLFVCLVLALNMSIGLAYADDLVEDGQEPPVEDTIPAEEGGEEDFSPVDEDSSEQGEETGTNEEPSEPESPEEPVEPTDDPSIITPDDPDEASEDPQEEPFSLPPDGWTLFPADTSPVDTRKAFQYKTLSSIALAESRAEDSTEFPIYSDSVKYNTWFYGCRTYNTFKNGEYIQSHGWNATFVSWCAEEAGLIEAGRFPRVSDGSVMFSWFLSNSATMYGKDDLLTQAKASEVDADDLIFFPIEGNYWVGIITGCDGRAVTFVQGDTECSVVKTRVAIENLPDDITIVKWHKENDYLLSYVLYLCDVVGCTPTAAVGVIANMMSESRCNPHALGDGGSSYGLCQWHGVRWERMVQVCDEAGLDYTTAEGQMYYLAWEMQFYKSLLTRMNAQPQTARGAYEAAYLFSMEFERPAAMEDAAMNRGYYASKWLYPLIIGK